jgi:hypothetical protein
MRLTNVLPLPKFEPPSNTPTASRLERRERELWTFIQSHTQTHNSGLGRRRPERNLRERKAACPERKNVGPMKLDDVEGGRLDSLGREGSWLSSVPEEGLMASVGRSAMNHFSLF